jgi:hypothetical protein
MQDSKLGYQVWAIAVFLFNANLKSVSSMELHRDLGVSQKSAWHLAHRIRECWDDLSGDPFAGPVEVDETYVGGRAKNMHAKVRRERITGRDGVDKTTVVAAKDRATNRIAATVVGDTGKATLQGFVAGHSADGAMIYTDEHRSYEGLPRHRTVRHSVAGYVRDQAHVNGVESFWAGLKRGYHGTFHHVSPRHPDRYVREFAGRHSRRGLDTEAPMAVSARGMIGKRLRYAELVRPPEPAAAAPAAVPAGHPF